MRTKFLNVCVAALGLATVLAHSTVLLAQTRPAIDRCNANGYCVGDRVVVSCRSNLNGNFLRLGRVRGFAPSGGVLSLCQEGDKTLNTIVAPEALTLNLAKAKSTCTTNPVGANFCACDTIKYESGLWPNPFRIVGLYRNRSDKTEIVYVDDLEFQAFMRGKLPRAKVHKATPSELLGSSWKDHVEATNPGDCLKESDALPHADVMGYTSGAQ